MSKMSKMKTLTGRDPVTGKGLHIIVQDDRIDDIRHTNDTGNRWLSTGLIDLQDYHRKL